jgi:hypothetical protein
MRIVSHSRNPSGATTVVLAGTRQLPPHAATPLRGGAGTLPGHPHWATRNGRLFARSVQPDSQELGYPLRGAVSGVVQHAGET